MSTITLRTPQVIIVLVKCGESHTLVRDQRHGKNDEAAGRAYHRQPELQNVLKSKGASGIEGGTASYFLKVDGRFK